MTDVDTSSYLKPTLPTAQSPLDIASKLGGLQQQKQSIQSGGLTIQKQQLDLVNQRFGTLAKQLIGLANKPDLNEKDITSQIQNDVSLGILPPDMAAKLTAQIPPNSNPAILKAHVEQLFTNAQTGIEALNFHYAPYVGQVGNGQVQQPAAYSQKTGQLQSAGPSIQQYAPPTTPTVATGANPNIAPGTPQLLGPVPTPAPLQPKLPTNGNLTGPGKGIVSQSLPVEAPAQSEPIITGTPPMFEEGKKQLAADQDLATQKLTAIKPVLQALPLLKDLRTGPGTSGWNKAVAFLKANNIISIDDKADPTAIYQEVNKKLNQYIQGSGTRSDADLAQREVSSPNVGTQISPALIKLTKDAIILDRVQAARPNAFESADYSKYGQHRSTFPAQIDERAFGLDLMEPKERNELITEMKKKKDTFEGKKFWKSLAIVDKQGLINTGGE